MAGITPLSGSRRVAATLALAMANFMVVLDTTIANVSVPTIAGGLAVSPSQGTWVITSYAVAEAIVVPLTGWYAARLGAVRAFTLSVLGFGFISMLCGLAGSLEMLVAMRIAQGLAGGPLMALSQTILLSSYPREKAGAAIGIWSMTTLLAPIAGPLLGGWISASFSWPWIFFINLPMAIICALLVREVYRGMDSERVARPVDTVGVLLLITWVGALQLVLDKGRELDWFGSPLIVALAVTSVVAFVFFVIWELDTPHPAVDVHLFANRNFLIGVMAMSLIFGVFFGSVVLIPLWLQTQMGYTSLWAGYATAPIGVLAVVAAPMIAMNLGRVDPRAFLTLSMTVFCLTFLMRHRFSTDITFLDVALPQFLQGMAMPMFFLPLNALALSGIHPSQLASASGLQNFVRTLAAAFSAALATTLWDDWTTAHRAVLVEHITNTSPATVAALDRMTGAGLPPDGALGLLNGVVQQQASTLAFADYFYYAAMLLPVVALLTWVARPARGGGGELRR
ncbi:MAG: DHA2 family efflux MFS transporter permease subunit [Nitrospirota bacterium]|nr:DHA2 family efflux MFS transporter permease subunit [Nitrospirota bacterium]